MKNILEVKNLEKSYGDLNAVKGVSFSVVQGSFFSFVGPNGAGKSTTINMICTMLAPGGGSITIDGFTIGKDDNEIRKIIGVVFQGSFLDKVLTVEQNLRLRATFYDYTDEKTDEVLEYLDEILDIKPLLFRKYGTLSGGERRRIDIAYALVNIPKLLILDEPTTGLDPHARKAVWDSIKRIQADKKITVFLTTHYMEEIRGSDKVVVIRNGKIAAEGTPEQLRLKYAHDELRIMPEDDNALRKELEENDIKYEVDRDIFEVAVKDSREALGIMNKLSSFKKFELISGNMDEVFLNVNDERN